MIARIRLKEFREPYTRKLRRSWIAERFDTQKKEWTFICAEDSCMKSRMYLEEYCRFKQIEIPKVIDIVR